jgi:hypothetical protein
MKRLQYLSLFMTIFVTVGTLDMFCPFPLAANQNQTMIERGIEQTPAESPEVWGVDDLVTWIPQDVNAVKPSMDEAPNGDLYVAVKSGNAIKAFRLRNGSEHWSQIFFVEANNADNPSLTYAEGEEDWVYIAYEGNSNTNSKSVRVVRFDPRDSFNRDHTTVESGIIMADADDHIYPEICSDYLDYDDYQVYVTYAKYGSDYYRVYFARSMDFGLSWSTPTNVTGVSQNSSWPARPDITYGSDNGSDNLFIVFEKPGWNGISWNNHIWVTRSTTWGNFWSTPVQLTVNSLDNYHPRIAAAMDVNSAVVAFTTAHSSDTDISYVYTTDGGTSWSSANELPWTLDDEEGVELSVSHSTGRFHAAFWHENDIHYTWADAGSPTSWAAIVVVNEGNTASGIYTRPAVAVNPTKPLTEEGCVAWTDFRDPYYNVYFDSASAGLDLAEFAADFGRTDCGVPTSCPGDSNNDGDVDGLDLAIF